MSQAGTGESSVASAARPTAARRWAWALGFCLPLAGGLPLSRWIPGYVDQLTPVRLVTIAALVWIVFTSLKARRLPSLPPPSRRLVVAIGAALIYAAVTLIWAPSRPDGIHALLGIGVALATAVAIMLVVGCDLAAVAGLARGILWAGVLQVALTVVELTTGFHVSTQFGASYLESGQLTNIEQVYGPIAIGTLGNPNDLGAFLLLALAVFFSSAAFGVEMSQRARWAGWVVAIAAMVVGLGFLADARGFRLGLLLVGALHLVDRLLPNGPNLLRIPALALSGLAAIVLTILPIRSWLVSFVDEVGNLPSTGPPIAPPPEVITESDNVRVRLLMRAIQAVADSFGFGRGIGTEQAMLTSGELSINFHNVVAQLAAEVGVVVAVAYLMFLMAILVRWAFRTRGARELGSRLSLARATLTLAVFLYGAVSSGVLQSPLHWGFFAIIGLMAGLPRAGQAASPGEALEAGRVSRLQQSDEAAETQSSTNQTE